MLVASLKREVETELIRLRETPFRGAIVRLRQRRLVRIVLIVHLQDGGEPLEEVLANLELGGGERQRALALGEDREVAFATDDDGGGGGQRAAGVAHERTHDGLSRRRGERRGPLHA